MLPKAAPRTEGIIARLEELTPGASVRGVVPDALVTVVAAQSHGAAVTLTYRTPDGRVAERLLYRADEPHLEVAAAGRPWTFDADGDLFRLVSEAKRISLAHLFDPYVAVTTASVEPLPHQITAVYEEMLSRQPLRYLLADDPGAGKTIMTGLFIRELVIRGDLRRCLIIVPGSLVDQWQTELADKFHLPFGVLTRAGIEVSKSGNPFNDEDLLIARLDMLSRNEELQDKLEASHDWDLIVFDEAHKLSATLDADGMNRTKRRVLADRCRELARHFLLLTATPHTGKPEEFELFMSLLDPDRFERQHRVKESSPQALARADDLMRRLVKENLVHFDGTPLFPPRTAETVPYELTPEEHDLYEQVTRYVREEMNRADRLREKEGQRKRGLIVGFALTVLQRRLASSPEAIYRSLHRRRERLEKRLAEWEAAKDEVETRLSTPEITLWDERDIAELEADAEEVPAEEAEELEEQVLDLATAASTIAELRAEIASLHDLETLAADVRRLGTDRKWAELSSLVQDAPEMHDAAGARRKLVVFTEHRDTLEYLATKLRNLIGRPEAVVTIHGGLNRQARRSAETAFLHDPEVYVLVATDAAGEGINLQRAHLMVNYDLPWNPNRLEQRFGRIHRIGQTEVCHLWNLVAIDTREGEVYARLLEKIEEERKALGDQVFDVLGQLNFGDRPLRQLMIEAIRAGDAPELRAQLTQVVDQAVDREHLRGLLTERALGSDVLDASKVQDVREEMERARARKLQPHFIRSFFLAAFERLGGRVGQRERGRYEVSRVPAIIRERADGVGPIPIARAYERIVFDKDLTNPPGYPLADFVCPGHPLLDATVDVFLSLHADLLRRGAVLIDPSITSEAPRVLVYLEHTITDQRLVHGSPQVVSRRLEFVELSADGSARAAGAAPYLDYRAATGEEIDRLRDVLAAAWLTGDGAEQHALDYGIEHLARAHLDEVRSRIEQRVDRTRAAVYERLTQEIAYWDRRTEELKAQELAGKTPRLNSGKARQRADLLTERRDRRMHELDLERQLTPLPPLVIGAAVVVPARALTAADAMVPPELGAKETKRIELAAMRAVIEAERAMGHQPRDVSAQNLGYDVESREADGRLRFIEVKGRAKGATTVTVTKNEILTCLNALDRFWLAIVEVGDATDGDTKVPTYVQAPFGREPDFAVTSVNYSIKELLGKLDRRDAVAEATPA